MAILIRTSDVPPEELRDAWRAVVCDTLGPLDFRSDPDIPLRGEIAAGQLGPVSVGRVETSTPHSVHRTPGLIRRDSPELYRVALTMSGQACLMQDGRTARLRPGEFTVYDFTRPYELAYDSGVQLRIHAFIEQHLGDLDLAPGSVAAAHYISVRFLYRLFESQGTTVAAWIRHRRLERCRADLADPALGGAPVSAVAARWGLPDPAHFNRLFKRTYGLPPAEYRRACLMPDS